MRPSRRRRAAGVAALLTAGALAACGGADPAPAAAPAPPLTTGFKQYRGDEAGRVVQIGVTNAGAQPVTVDAVRLDAAGFGPGTESRPGARLAPGETTDFSVTYGDALCEARPGAPAPGAVVSVRTADGRVARQRVAFTKGLDEFDRVHGAECGALAVAEAVKLSWAPSWSPGTRKDSLRGVLRVRRASPGPAVTVDQVAGSVIFTLWTVPDGVRPAATMPPGADEAAVTVEAVPTRCDGHARAESKKTFVFPVWVALDGGEPVYTTVTVTGEGRRRLQVLIDDVCGVLGLPAP